MAQGQSAPPSLPNASPPAGAIDRPMLERLYQAELGSLFRPPLSTKLFDAHLLLEKYFAAPTAAQRSDIVKQLEAMGLEPAVLGRIIHIRLYRPALAEGLYYVNERVGPHQVNYFVGLPRGYDRIRPWPLLIKLPGAHAFATKPPPTADEVVRIYTGWINEELRIHPDAIVLMPLLDLDELWGPSYKGVNNVMQPLFHAAGRLNIDPRRVYLRGHGMSGHAVWNLALHYPTYFAAINPMSGGANVDFQRLRLGNLRNVLPVVWHDADDPVIKVQSSRDLVKILRTKKLDVDYEETKLVGHAPTADIAERLYAKMRQRTRELYPKEVSLTSNRPDTLFNRADWVQVYQMLTSGPDMLARLQHGSGIIRLTQNSYTLSARLAAPNRVEIRSENVESMRLYFNDQMVDFSRPVSVLVNGRVRFEGLLRPSLEEMLKDQMFLGRGWRYFTAFIDIDFGALATQPATQPGRR